jgi:ubiquinone/menaquinone biosynthesis C-methylase UbiE
MTKHEPRSGRFKDEPGRGWDVCLRDRLKSYFAGRYLETVNPRLKGSPHGQLAAMVHAGEADILEVCAGTGFLSRIIAGSFPHARISALDFSPELIAEGRRRARGLHNLEFIRGDVTAMPYADSSFDLVLAAFGLSELSPEARSECLREIDRVVTRRGRLLVLDIDDPLRHAGLFHAYRYLSHGQPASDVLGNGLVRQMESRGFETVRHLTRQGRLFPFQIIVAHKSATDAST